MKENPLGNQTNYPKRYDPQLLFAIARQESRARLGLQASDFYGVDVWRAWELSWLNGDGVPQVAIGRFVFDSRSENLVESKSLKLYLNSLNNEKFETPEELQQRISADLIGVSRSAVQVSLLPFDDDSLTRLVMPAGHSIDQQQPDLSHETCDVSRLKTHAGNPVRQTLYSNLFRSNCPVTGQPDWATVVVLYRGARIDQAGLLAYLCSFRNHQGYHEECAELIFRDIRDACSPAALTVKMHYTRRGGLEINPCRSSEPVPVSAGFARMVRQ